LKTRSDAVAAHLMKMLPDDRSPVAVLGSKQPEMIAAFLGCIKARHPYVPLDASLPRQRIDDILTASGARLTLTPEFIASGLPRLDLGNVVRRSLAPSDPYYILFTSGSTGTPKGVSITLECLTDFIDWMEEDQPFSDHEIFLNQVSYSFDVSVMDTYLALVTGGTTFSITRDHIDSPATLYQALADSGVTIWVSTPAFVHMCLAERRFDRRMLPNVTRFFLAGEALPPAMVAQLFDRFPGAEVWNMYGPTEATVVVTAVRIERDMLSRYPALPIGYPKRGTEIVVVDPAGNPVADGQRGEIIIAGPNVSPGYINSPEGNERRFFTWNGARAYRTGDEGHFEDGMVFFDGRMDNQIKLHGYRIELGDVETHVAALPGVRDAIVLPVGRNGRVESLQAFVILDKRPNESEFDMSNRLRSGLAERLPVHMLPRRFRFLQTFPMTVNGKVDRRKLAELD
jgi:D-alanine--poly(phosphoribitol) ligase subunit 1